MDVEYVEKNISIFEDTVFSKEKLENWISENYSRLMGMVRID